tara:strand:+ start:3491 stop:3664 length:174 start_codon:yes stop_codon:yes gene_type:complete
MNKKEEIKLTPEEVQEKLLKVTIANNKRLKSIDYSLGFIVLVIVIGILITIFGLFIK